MALARVNRHQQTSGANHGTGAFTTTSFTPANNTLLLVIAHAVEETDAGLEGTSLTISDSLGSTWTSRVATTTSPFWSYGSRAWTAPVTVGASMTVSIDAGASNVQVYRVEVFEYSDYNTTTPIGSIIVGSDADGNDAATITLPAAPESTSEVIATNNVVYSLNDGNTTVGAGWTELFDVIHSGWANFQSQVRSASTSTAVDWADLSTAGTPLGASLLAIEIRQAPTGIPSGAEKTPFFLFETGDEDYLATTLGSTRWFDKMLVPLKWFHEWLEPAAGGTTFFQDVGGTLSLAGALLKQTGKVLTGTLTSAGELVRQTNKVLAGTLTTAGALLKQTSTSLAGTLGLAGTLTKETLKSFTGTLNLSGALTSIRLFIRDVGGTLGLSGDLTKQTQKVLAGTLTTAGAISKQTSKLLSATLTTAGDLVKQTSKFFTGTLGLSAVLATLYIPFTPGGAVRGAMRRMFNFFAGRR